MSTRPLGLLGRLVVLDFKRERHAALALVGIGRGNGRRIQPTTFQWLAVVTANLFEIAGAAARAVDVESWHEGMIIIPLRLLVS
jgi:hypothetical protein